MFEARALSGRDAGAAFFLWSQEKHGTGFFNLYAIESTLPLPSVLFGLSIEFSD